MRIMNAVFASIISFGVIYNCALITLAERSRDMATLRIMGFHRREVSYILLGELAIITLLAIPIGLPIGYGFAFCHHAGPRHRDAPFSLGGQSRHLRLFNLCHSRGGSRFVIVRSPKTGQARFDRCDESERVMKKILSKIPWIVIVTRIDRAAGLRILAATSRSRCGRSETRLF